VWKLPHVGFASSDRESLFWPVWGQAVPLDGNVACSRWRQDKSSQATPVQACHEATPVSQ
jgi:hypothetical protein